ncbi:MAG: hypothetical protein O0V67_01615 [Methanocorpusculum sp.]|nr:hypothetical protein [Methanocorpusculum sp.]
MNSGQERIIAEFAVIRNSILNIKDILRDERPLTYKNSSALKGELHDMLRHTARMEEWTSEDQEET